jgi:hypothetical protein
MIPECPAFSSRNISGGRRGCDFVAGAMARETSSGIPNSGAGAAAL